MQHLLEFSQVLQGDCWKSKASFTKYFRGSVFPKFVLLLTHENNMYPILQMFDQFRVSRPKFGSSIFLDFFSRDNQDYLKVVYKEDAASEEALHVDGKSVVTL